MAKVKNSNKSQQTWQLKCRQSRFRGIASRPAARQAVAPASHCFAATSQLSKTCGAFWFYYRQITHMKKLIILFHCLLAYNLVFADQTNTIPQVWNAGLTGKVLRHEIALSEVAKLPASSEITEIVISGLPRTDTSRLTEAEFRQRFDSAKPVKSDDDYLRHGDFGIGYSVTFETKTGRFYAELNGGLSFLKYPDGRVVAFNFYSKLR